MTERKRTAVERLAEDDAERELEAREYAWAVEQYTAPAPSKRPPVPVPAPAAPATPARTDAPEFLDTAAAARMLGMTPKALESLRCRGRGPAFVRIGRSIRYRREDLLRGVPHGSRRGSE